MVAILPGNCLRNPNKRRERMGIVVHWGGGEGVRSCCVATNEVELLL